MYNKNPILDINITDMTVNGNCSNCGECCTDFIPMTTSEVDKIHQYLKLHPEIKEQHHLFVKYDITCPFNSVSTRKCLIYKVRPEVCRSFMCNKSHKVILSEKFKFHKRGKVIQMRKEFFNNIEYDKMFSEIFNLEIK